MNNLIVVKRDGRKQNYMFSKILKSIKKASSSIKYSLSEEDEEKIKNTIVEYLKDKKEIEIEKLQDYIEKTLYVCGFRKVRDAYKDYRKDRTISREKKSNIMNTIKSIGVMTDKDNANVGGNFSAKLLRIASESNKWAQLASMPKEMAKRHEMLDTYIHDLDSFNLTPNCLHVPTRQALLNGFNTGYGYIRPPKRIESAAELSCILLQSTQNDLFGGQSHPDFDNDLGLFVEPTRQEIIQNILNINPNIEEEMLKKKTQEILLKRINQAMQEVIYNLNTMHARAGSQVPFSSINLGLPDNEDAALVCECFLKQYEKGLGKAEQPIFPNIIFRVKEGVNREPGDPYYYLYQLSCRVSAKRMMPTYMNMDADFNKKWIEKGIKPSTMGCRTYLVSNVNGEHGCAGRGNNAPQTINLPRLGIKAMMSSENIDERIETFFNSFDYLIEKTREDLLYRYEILKKLKVKDIPFVAGQNLMKGAEGLKENDSIEPILKQGTWGIGFIGLAETLVALTGKHHGEDEFSRDLGERIVQHLRNRCDEFKEKDKMNWSCYATPAEGLSGKFVPVDRKIYGEIKGVTDKDFYTNSYHIPVDFKISIKDKLLIEAPYHKMCNGGHISYIELDNYPTPEVVENIISYAYKNSNISYIGVNFHIRYCKECGTYLSSELKCPKCNSVNIQGVSRITGYLGLDERFGPGKEAERSLRISHNGDKKHHYTLKK